MRFILFIIIVFCFELVTAQNDSTINRKNKILENTNVENLRKLSSEKKADFYKKQNEAIKWAKKYGFIVNKKMSDGSYVSLIEVKNGRPIYISTYGTRKEIKSRIDSTLMNNIAKENGYPLDTTFCDGSKAKLKIIQNGKPIYIFIENEQIE